MEIGNKNTTILKDTSSLYHIRHDTIEGWADVFLATGDCSVSVMINSDYGVFSYSTEYCSRSPLEFIANASKNHILKKLFGKHRYVIDKEACINQILVDIKNACNSGVISEDDSKRAVAYIDELQFSDPSLYYYQIVTDVVLGSIYQDSNNIPVHSTDNHICEPLWNDIWLPFTNQLKKEISLTTTH
ncbi:hypothetical protein [Photobacterium damselae]|uniref:hypothetical protein n=1 Tax=Photobacterium damselae TaxID=38293 RepID=UPI004068C98E